MMSQKSHESLKEKEVVDRQNFEGLCYYDQKTLQHKIFFLYTNFIKFNRNAGMEYFDDTSITRQYSVPHV